MTNIFSAIKIKILEGFIKMIRATYEISANLTKKNINRLEKYCSLEDRSINSMINKMIETYGILYDHEKNGNKIILKDKNNMNNRKISVIRGKITPFDDVWGD